MKKMLSILLIAAYLLSMGTVALGAQMTEAQMADLYALGIMIGDETGDLRLGDTITRAEAAKMLCVAGNLHVATFSEGSGFSDVPNAHWASRYIMTVKKNGIAVGDTQGNFNPDSSITNEEIVKMIVCLLGYEPEAEMRSGYPAGFMAVGTRLGITKDMQLAVRTPAVRQDVGVMLQRALDVPLMVQTENNADGVTFSIMDGVNGVPYMSLRESFKVN